MYLFDATLKQWQRYWKAASLWICGRNFAIVREFRDLPVPVAIAGQPEIVVGLDRDAVLSAARTAVAIEAALRRTRLALRKS